jgi:hypothetical protein
MSNPSIITVPDSFPADNQTFMERKPEDSWDEIHQWVIQNVPGVDPDKFTNQIMAIRDKHNAEAEPMLEAELKAQQENSSQPKGCPSSTR